jgi:hypothetical protein
MDCLRHADDNSGMGSVFAMMYENVPCQLLLAVAG